MKPSDFIRLALSFIIFVLLHVFIFKHFILFDAALCFLYIGFLLILPLSLPMPMLLLIGFLIGFFVDLFYDTIGIHIFTAVLFMFLKPKLVSSLTPLGGGYEEISEISINTMGIRRFLIYCLIAVLIQSFVIFFMEAGGFSLFYMTLYKTILSTIFTSFFILIFQYVFLTSKSN